MTLLVDIFIVLVIALMGFGGYRRGLWLVVCELASVVLATLLALVLYRPLGSMLQRTYHLPLALANVAMFAVVWMLTELLLAVLILSLIHI